MATIKRSNNHTPNGGVKSEAHYMNDKWEPADEKVATNVIYIEYDDKGNQIHRTYGTLNRKKEVSDGDEGKGS